MQPVLVIAAVERELALLVRGMHGEHVADSLLPSEWLGRVGSCDVVCAASGIGKVNAASAATALILRWQPRLIICTGCAGAYPAGGMQVGELAVASSEISGDEGVLTPEGWQSLEAIGIPSLEIKGQRYFNEIPLSFSAAEQAFQLAAALDLPLRRGRFVTVSTCSGTAGRGHDLYERFGALCENMEGAAVAQVALQYGIDCLELRGISNMVEDRDLSRWNLTLAVEQAQRFILRHLEQL